ncbi:16S rRNA (guanine(966)-N(2))-methyltransferase RsmD [Neobacillus notoginsengisoli]|uniref:16S rRNA (Guanine(966)-N(2))-methyltransferase RsmD n=1 Tax=Neobacillus notoginsengisoli TaxID=1578198 RepID=A0A417YQY2_9BACI|nr:16S rRNA (guanine(966)-N(2))-methyltransferase RsmD [Neobacillus notoginsengisoli]RHW36522.1 16S rRNA (guanine(966)-N(2))-methyltransferase RsmD [Neobacillus notoginsengisoli]
MRVVSGICKGRPLKSVPGTGTRPTTDKVKEAIFNMIGPFFSGGTGLDLYAGSGGLGIEALSRGLDQVIFVDRDPKAVMTIKENIKACSFEEQTEVYRTDSQRALKALKKRSLEFDYIFLDPPYKKQQLISLLERISDDERLKLDGKIICEHGKEVKLPETVGSLNRIKDEIYGIIAISIYAFRETGQGGNESD